jgi:hypothetical protein
MPRASIETFVGSQMALTGFVDRTSIAQGGPLFAPFVASNPQQYYAMLRYDPMTSIDRLQLNLFFCLSASQRASCG